MAEELLTDPSGAEGVEEVEEKSLVFGPAGAGLSHRNGPHFDDIDGDGLLDLVAHHRIAETGIAANDIEACLVGETVDGQSFVGCDLVTPLSR